MKSLLSRGLRSAPAVAVLAATVLVCALAHAEVSVSVQNKGQYIKFFNSSEVFHQLPQVWGRVYSSWNRLNEWGDIYGDLPPAYVYLPEKTNTPFVIWPYKTPSGDYDLAFSWFEPRSLRWTRTSLIDPRPNDTNEIHPRAVYGEDRAVHLAWESVGAYSQVFYSRYNAPSGWTQPLRLSHPDMSAVIKAMRALPDRVEISLEETELIWTGQIFRVGKVVVKTYTIPTTSGS